MGPRLQFFGCSTCLEPSSTDVMRTVSAGYHLHPRDMQRLGWLCLIRKHYGHTLCGHAWLLHSACGMMSERALPGRSCCCRMWSVQTSVNFLDVLDVPPSSQLLTFIMMPLNVAWLLHGEYAWCFLLCRVARIPMLGLAVTNCFSACHL